MSTAAGRFETRLLQLSSAVESAILCVPQVGTTHLHHPPSAALASSFSGRPSPHVHLHGRCSQTRPGSSSLQRTNRTHVPGLNFHCLLPFRRSPYRSKGLGSLRRTRVVGGKYFIACQSGSSLQSRLDGDPSLQPPSPCLLGCLHIANVSDQPSDPPWHNHSPPHFLPRFPQLSAVAT